MSRLLAVFALMCFIQLAYAQDAADLINKGKQLLADRKFQQALATFQQAEELAPSDAEIRTNIGICLYHLHQPTEAEAQLFGAFQAKNNPPTINYLYLAKLHQARLDFEKAADFYKQFLKRTPHDHPWRPAVRDEIRRCVTGLMLRRQTPVAAVVPLSDVNSSADEFAPLPSPSGQERLYFSANGRSDNATDIFFTEINAGDWSTPKPLNRFVNGAHIEIALGFDETGSKLYFSRSETLESSQILIDTFHEDPLEGTLFFEQFSGPMRPEEGDRAPFFFNDSILLFSSRRSGGFGGYDIYVSIRKGNDWLPATNLGPVINSPYDETSPFLSRDGRTLYFSSNDAARSMGGLDILRATWLDWSARWSPPLNLGPPINSSSDDEHFRLSNSGDRAFFDSDRITGEGRRDIFVALFEEPREWQRSVSDPVAFCLVHESQKDSQPSERSAQPPGSFFDEIFSFELPVMALPPPGGTPSEQTVNQFALLSQLLKKYPKLQLTVALHSALGDDPVGAFLYASQIVTDLFRQEGMGMERVTLLFAGSSFPVAGKERRAEVFIENPTLLPFELYRSNLPKTAFKAQFFQKSMTSLVYRVVVEAGMELPKLFELYPEGLVERRTRQSALLFSPGLYLTNASAEEWRHQLIMDGYTTATIVPYLRGRALTKDEAAKYIEDFPDLLNFIKNE